MRNERVSDRDKKTKKIKTGKELRRRKKRNEGSHEIKRRESH